MLFNSYEFLFLLLPLTLAGYYLFLPKAWRHAWLTLCSFVFYGWWDYRYLGLLLLAITLDYVAGGRIAAAADPAKKKRWLLVSICGDMGMLGFFKYYDLGAGTVNALGQFATGSDWLPLLHLVLPVGISFIGAAYQEPTLLKLAYAFEQATKARQAPRFLPTVQFAD